MNPEKRAAHEQKRQQRSAENQRGIERSKQVYDPSALQQARELQSRLALAKNRMHSLKTDTMRKRAAVCHRYLDHLRRVLQPKDYEEVAPYNEKIRERITVFLDRSTLFVLANVIDQYEKGTEVEAHVLRKEDIEESIHMMMDITAPAGYFTAAEYHYNARYFREGYRQFGSVKNLKRLVTTVDDWTFSADERKREEAAVEDMKAATDLHLGEIGAALRHVPSDKRGTSATYRRAQKRYRFDVQELAELYVGVGDVTEDALYDSGRAYRYAKKAGSLMSMEEVLSWAKTIDTRLGHFSDVQAKEAATMLFAGIREVCTEKIVIMHREARGDLKKEEACRAMAVRLAILFRTEGTAREQIVTMNGVEDVDHYRFGGQAENADFSEEMAKQGFDFEGLAYKYQVRNLGKPDPLHAKVQSEWPALQKRLQELSNYDQLQKLPAFQSMVGRLNTGGEPSSFQESCARYVVFTQLSLLSVGLYNNFSPSAMQEDIQERGGQFLFEAGENFASFLGKQYGELQSGEYRVAGEKLSPTQQEALEILVDIQGLGVFDLSDTTWGYTRMAASIATQIATGIALGIATGGMSLLAQAAIMGVSLTALNAAIEGKGAGSVRSAVDTYSAELATNTAGALIGGALGRARQAMQVAKHSGKGASARQLFLESMKKAGMGALSQEYDNLAIGFGKRILAISAEGTLDVTASSGVDTLFLEGTTFIDNLQSNAAFFGFSFGLELRGAMLHRIRDAELAGLQRLTRKTTAQRQELSKVCEGIDMDPQWLYGAEDIDGVLRDAGVTDAGTREKAQNAVEKLRRLAGENAELQQRVEQLVANRQAVTERLATLDESDVGRQERVKEGLQLLVSEGLVKDANGQKIDVENLDSNYAEAILAAHDIGKPPYSEKVLAEKRKKLLTIFSADQADALMRTGVAGQLLRIEVSPRKRWQHGDVVELTDTAKSIDGKTIPIGQYRFVVHHGSFILLSIKNNAEYYFVPDSLRFSTKEYRTELARSIQDAPRHYRRTILDETMQSPDYWSAREAKMRGQASATEQSINGGMGIKVKKLTLYHGSKNSGLQEFAVAERMTIGDGVYFTSQANVAVEYAKHRTNYDAGKQPHIYEGSAENLVLLDLRTNDNIHKFLQDFEQYLRVVHGPEFTIPWKSVQDINFENLRDALKDVGSDVSAYAASIHYDGIIALEGGEGNIGNHDTYVIFNPSRVVPTRQRLVKKRQTRQAPPPPSSRQPRFRQTPPPSPRSQPRQVTQAPPPPSPLDKPKSTPSVLPHRQLAQVVIGKITEKFGAAPSEASEFTGTFLTAAGLSDAQIVEAKNAGIIIQGDHHWILNPRYARDMEINSTNSLQTLPPSQPTQVITQALPSQTNVAQNTSQLEDFVPGQEVWFAIPGRDAANLRLGKVTSDGHVFIKGVGRFPIDDSLRSTMQPVQNLQTEFLARLELTDGWKIHLHFDPNNKNSINAVKSALENLKLSGRIVQYKISDFDSTGKTATLYVGHGKLMREVADQLASDLDGVLLPPTSLTLSDDILVNKYVAARFDLSSDTDFNQYGRQGVPNLALDHENMAAQKMRGLLSIEDVEAYTRNADLELRRRYGDFYSEGFGE